MGKQVTLKYQISEGRKRIASEYLEGRRLLRERYKTGRVETSKGEVGNRDLKEEIEVKNGAVGRWVLGTKECRPSGWGGIL